MTVRDDKVPRYVTNLAGARYSACQKRVRRDIHGDQLIREGDKGEQAGRPLLMPKGLCLPEEPPKPATLFLGL